MDEVTQVQNVEELWRIIKNAIKSSVEKVIPNRGNRRRKAWMTEEILDLMEERRKQKHRSCEQYRRVNKQITRKIKEAKEKWLIEQCEKIEELQNTHKVMLLPKRISELCGSIPKKCHRNLENDQINPLLSIEGQKEV
jgi:seryl-tRNA synthetase